MTAIPETLTVTPTNEAGLQGSRREMRAVPFRYWGLPLCLGPLHVFGCGVCSGIRPCS